ncbi:MAG TPA: transglycosylase domain-containing protein [Patescibacteria group bacterium]|jgi:1A family penicillin-binding protein|nr:transglycosylase domain-containing protein [Patescibacteria group bacterium]
MEAEYIMKTKKVIKKINATILKFLAVVALGFFGVFFIIGVVGLSYLIYVDATLPSYQELAARDVAESSKLYSRDGTLLYEFHGEYNRTSVDLDRISPFLREATISVEDKDFYHHGAVSLTSIARAVMANYKNGSSVQGGSTITQQFVKNALLDRKKLYSRKIREILLSYKVESHFNKDQILELYLNEIPYGRNAYGAEAASQSYFGKSASELSLAESAYLAALPQAPSFYSPTGANYDALVKRQNMILEQMHNQGYITELEMHQAQNQTVAFREPKSEIIAPYFVSYIQNYLTEKYGKQFLREGGLRVYTTLDLNLQNLAEKVVKEGAEANKKYGAYNAALVAVEPATGKILAMAGGKDYFGSPEPAGCKPGVNCKFEPNVNVATSERQPGSSFKPYMYMTSFEPQFGYTPMSKVLDEPTSFGTSNGRAYVPRNYDGTSHGLITIRKAMAGSLNVPAVRMLATIGVDPVVKTAHDLGISSPLKNCGLSLVLGGCEVQLVDHVGAFAVIANGGKGKGETPFNRIEDKHGNVLEEYHEDTTQTVNPEAVYELTSIMTDNASRAYVFGQHSPLEFTDRPVACKTGTTQSWKDGWTLCFTPQIAAGVWAGNNDSSLMHAGADGVFVAAPMEHRFMEEALKGQPAVDFPVPSGIVQVAYDASGRPAGKVGPSTHMEPFPWYSLPKDIQVSAAPKSLNKNLFSPVEANVPQAPQTPLTAPSNLPPSETGPVAPRLAPPISPPAVTETIPSPYDNTNNNLPDYGGLPNDYPTEPQATTGNRPS